MKNKKPWQQCLDAGESPPTEPQEKEALRQEKEKLDEEVRGYLKEIQKAWLELEKNRIQGQILALDHPPKSEKRLLIDQTLQELKAAQKPLEWVQEKALKMLA